MSLATIYRTKKAAKPLVCERCREPIPVGTPYAYFFVGFRSRLKHPRHDTPACLPRDSERESSNKAPAMAAKETASDALGALDAASVEESDVAEILQQAADEIREVIDQYREVEGVGQSRAEEIADEIEAGVLGIEDWSSGNGDWDPGEADAWCDQHAEPEDGIADSVTELEERRASCADCMARLDEARRDWGQALIDEAQSALDDVEI